MAIKDQFTAEEWAKVAAAPLMAGMAVTAADPGGIWGAIRESTSVAEALARAKAGENELVDAVVDYFRASEGRGAVGDTLKAYVKGKKPDEIVEALLSSLTAARAAVEAKAPAAAPGFIAWLSRVAHDAAEAGTEGGFLGFGGVKVSEAEKALLARLGTVLGVPSV